jgi:NitT/TauT family transport system substrate-binding protein
MHDSRASFLWGTTAAAGASLLPSSLRAQSPTLTTINLGATPSDDMTPILYGRQAGIFRKYGLELQINRSSNGAATAAGLLSGTYDFAKASVTTILTAHEKGIPFTIVGESTVNDPKTQAGAFVVLKDSPIQSGKDFNDQLVGCAAIDSIGTIALSLWVQQHGGNPKSIKFVEIPFPAAGPAVIAGRVVAALISNPNLEVALESGKLRAVPAILDSIAPMYVEVAWATTLQASAARPDVVHAFVRAYRESVTYTNAHHGETVALVSEFTGIAPAVIGKMARVLAWPTVNAAHIQPVIEASVRVGALARSFPAADIIDANARDLRKS